jgi:hypothetical protein
LEWERRHVESACVATKVKKGKVAVFGISASSFSEICDQGRFEQLERYYRNYQTGTDGYDGEHPQTDD